MTSPETTVSFTGPAQRANWACAFADRARVKQLGPALRKAWSDQDAGTPNPEALAEALRVAQMIAAVLGEAQRLLSEADNA